MAPILTAIYCPDGTSSGEIVRYLLEEHDIKIAGGLGQELKDRLIRIGHMGATVGEEDIDAVLDGLADFLRRR
jgi:alanine-glyoxylate transaminase/serine-glyoxylate transaminase/serine-pyruvate transaminase